MSQAETQSDFIAELLVLGLLYERFNELECVDVDRTPQDLSVVYFLDGSFIYTSQ